MAAVAGEPGVERQMRQRHITLSAETPAATHVVHVAAGTVTVLLFDSPVLPASLELGASRERFERVDITEGALILLPRMELTPQERIPLTLRFADGHIPNRVTFALMGQPGEVDRQVRVFRTALAPEALVEHLSAVQARCEDSGRFANLLFSRNVESGIVAEPLNHRPSTEEEPPRLYAAGMRAFIAPGFLVLEATLFLAKGQAPWRPGRVQVRVEKTEEEVPVRATDLDVPTLLPGSEGRLVLELPARPHFPSELLRIDIHEQGGPRVLTLGKVHLARPSAGETP
ncbi:DUF2381 family protein [Pyxidicoccus sp. QH1ED-7-1]|nr:DUF2381 family protein [Pyxidicoccus xibeiensis]